MSNLGKQLATTVRKLRNLRHWTQEDVALRTGKSLDAIGNIERGVNEPSLETIELLAKAFDISVSELFQSVTSSSARSSLITSLLDAARALDDRTLAVAVKQVEHLAALSRPRKS